MAVCKSGGFLGAMCLNQDLQDLRITRIKNQDYNQ